MSVVEDRSSEAVARWTVGGAFLEAFAKRDYVRMAAALDERVRFRAMLPRGPMDWEGRNAVADVFRSWFGEADDFELVDATVGEVGGRLHLSWRIRLRPAPFGMGAGWHVIEQQAYVGVGESIEALDLLCSGFQPDPMPER